MFLAGRKPNRAPTRRPRRDAVRDGWRGYFENVAYRDGELELEGCLFAVSCQIEAMSVFVNGRNIGDTPILERPDVAGRYDCVPHAGRSGFAVSWHVPPQEVDALVDLCVIGSVDGREVARVETWYVRDLPFGSPPPHLLRRELANESVAAFRALSLQSYRDLWTSVCKWTAPESIRVMLDWGCGCGRLLYPFKGLSGIPSVHGCDVDPEAIDWCERNLSGVRVMTNPFLPPTGYPDNFFDLIIGNSVFTHLEKDVQALWLEEMRRITSPGGLFLASVHGELATHFCYPDSDLAEVFGAEGINDDIADPSLDGILPDGWYRGTVQSQQHTRKAFGRYFQVLDYVEQGWLNHQDLVVMQKKR